jgi:hypothetical protein
MSLRFSIEGFEFFSRKTRTRFPFRYGIASMTEVPHLFVQVRLVMGRRRSVGLTSEGLPPKWFTKDPATTFEQDLPQMLAVIEHAAQSGAQIGKEPISFYHFWRDLYREQEKWADARTVPPLLANLGVSLVERAVLDALCRAHEKPLHALVRENLLDVRLGEIYPEVGRAEPRDLLPAEPAATALVRHTVGLADPLSRAETPEGERVDDGLPQDLEACIRRYYLRAFKIKLSGKVERDRSRLQELQGLLRREVGGRYLATVDGNENFEDFARFHEFWREVLGDGSLAELKANVAVIEQPVHRNQALDAGAAEVLRDWTDHPPLIIDESDGALGDLERALSLGYAGTSHKNCKGIVKGLANACLLEFRRRQGRASVLTAEDLCNLGPVALLQDLALVGLLGIPHVERNGHHYFRGLSMWPQDWQQAVRAAHSDVYTWHEQGFACLRIGEGALDLGSINAAPFGVKPLVEASRFERVELCTGRPKPE